MSSYMPLPIGASQAAGVAPSPSMATPIVGAQEDYVYNSLLKERIIWLGSEVRDSNANLICSQMLLLSAEDPEADIYLYINSPGGSVTAGMAASMGQFLLTAGTIGKRYATPNARILMHQPLGGIGGTASDIRTQAELILDMKKRLAEITAERTGKSLETILKDNDRDNWFNAEEGLEYGFFDHIATTAGKLPESKNA